MTATYQHPEVIVTTDWLAANLDDPPGVEAQVLALDESLDANDAIGALAARQRD